MNTLKITRIALALATLVSFASLGNAAEPQTSTPQVFYRTVKIDGLEIFYREAGRKDAPIVPKWQEYLRKHQPPTLIVWGKNDAIFPAAGAFPYKRDLKNLELHLLDTGHFALEEDGAVIAARIRDFLGKQLAR